MFLIPNKHPPPFKCVWDLLISTCSQDKLKIDEFILAYFKNKRKHLYQLLLNIYWKCFPFSLVYFSSISIPNLFCSAALVIYLFLKVLWIFLLISGYVAITSFRLEFIVLLFPLLVQVTIMGIWHNIFWRCSDILLENVPFWIYNFQKDNHNY